MAGTRYVTAASLKQRTTAWLAALSPARPRPVPPLDHAALMLLDLQCYFADPSSHAYLPALEAIVEPVLELARAFHAAKRPVILTRQGSLPGPSGEVMRHWWRDELRRGEPRAALCPAARAIEADLVLDKARYSAFSGTALRGWLAERGCDVVVLGGVMSHLCVESTAREAFMLDLQPIVVADACASCEEELHFGALRALAHGFAPVVSAQTILQAFGSARAGPGCEPAAPPQGELDLCIIGAGPAGLAAALEAKRAGTRVALLESQRPGGQARAANWIENYPGFPGGVRGEVLMERFWAQASGVGLQAVPFNVEAVETTPSGGYLLRGRGGGTISARAVVLATGAAPLPLPDLDLAPLGARAAFRIDALADVRERSILIVGGGEAALDSAIHASKRGASRVVVLMRGDHSRATELLQRRARRCGVDLVRRARLLEIEDPGSYSSPASFTVDVDGERSTLSADAVVVCAGKRPALPRLPPAVSCQNGAPQSDSLGRSSLPGLYFVGDVRRGPYRQVAIAVGDGVAAAMHACRYLAAADPLSAWRE